MVKVRDGLIPVMVGDDNDRTHCPVCGMSIRMERSAYYKTEEYVPRIVGEDVAQVLKPQDEETAEKLRKLREGKKTVALVGLAPTSCSLAPFDDEDVEIWALNETHAFPQWFKRWDRWFQIHHTKSWQKQIAKRDVRGHYDWLKRYHYGKFESVEQPHEHWQELDDFVKEEDGKKYVLIDYEWEYMKPIYMQYWNSKIPNSVEYPIREVSDNAFINFRRGDHKVKYFTSTLAYYLGIATLPEEGFERIEIYGFDLADDIEYIKQKACAEWWIGFAMGRGIEVYVPENSQTLYSSLYGGNDQGAGW